MGFDTKYGIMHYQQSIGTEPTGILTFSQFRTLVDGMPSAQEITSNNPDLLLPAEAKELQRALKARGYAVGKIDGVLGANSAKAIAQFLRDSGRDPQQTSLRAAFELASGNSSAGTGTGRDLAGPVAGETAARNAGESSVAIPAAFNLHIKDGAILTGDVSEMARGNPIAESPSAPRNHGSAANQNHERVSTRDLWYEHVFFESDRKFCVHWTQKFDHQGSAAQPGASCKAGQVSVPFPLRVNFKPVFGVREATFNFNFDSASSFLFKTN